MDVMEEANPNNPGIDPPGLRNVGFDGDDSDGEADYAEMCAAQMDVMEEPRPDDPSIDRRDPGDEDDDVKKTESTIQEAMSAHNSSTPAVILQIEAANAQYIHRCSEVLLQGGC